MKTIELVPNFVNVVNPVIESKYFPEVKCYLDNDKTIKLHYITECFSNGVLTYSNLIKKISKLTKESELNIIRLLIPYITFIEVK